MFRLLAALLLSCLTILAADTIEAFGLKWTVPIGSEWAVEGTGPEQVLKMLKERPSTQPRRPSQYAIAEIGPFQDVTIEAEVRRARQPENSQLIIVYAWRDAEHFDYAHFSPDVATKQPVHNGIFHVYGGDRVRISAEEGPPSLLSFEWTPVKVQWSGKSGIVRVWASGKEMPSMRGADLSLAKGKVGLGSFFHTAEFRKVRITGK